MRSRPRSGGIKGVGQEDREPASDEALFGSLYPGLRAFAASVGSSDIEPDDLVQEALVRVLERGSLTALDYPGAYLRRTILNLASNHRRGRGRWRAAVTRLRPDTEQPAEYPSDLADLDALDPVDRAVLHLTHIDGYPAAEVGRQLGLSENAVHLRSSRARKRLRKGIEDDPSYRGGSAADHYPEPT